MTSSNETALGRVAVALVHWPVKDKHGGIQTTSITNLDVHDIARSATTYGCAAFYVVTPVRAQQEMARAITAHWDSDEGKRKNPDRQNALRIVQIVASLQDAVDAEAAAVGARPVVVATSALPQGAVSYPTVRRELAARASTLVVFGTGHGLADDVIRGADQVLEPLVGPTPYNHLSVRSAAAIILDRLLAP